MTRAPILILIAALVAAVAIVLGIDPERPWAIAALIASIAVAVGAGAVAWQVRARRGRRRSGEARVVRRGVEMGVAIALLLWLRAVDGLSVITAAFVIGTLLVGEAVLSARVQSQR